jgi:hypothetical protein
MARANGAPNENQARKKRTKERPDGLTNGYLGQDHDPKPTQGARRPDCLPVGTHRGRGEHRAR